MNPRTIQMTAVLEKNAAANSIANFILVEFQL